MGMGWGGGEIIINCLRNSFRIFVGIHSSAAGDACSTYGAPQLGNGQVCGNGGWNGISMSSPETAAPGNAPPRAGGLGTRCPLGSGTVSLRQSTCSKDGLWGKTGIEHPQNAPSWPFLGDPCAGRGNSDMRQLSGSVKGFGRHRFFFPKGFC